MEKRTKYIPSLVTLLAAFIACIVSIYYKYTTRDILINVLITIVVFFVIGSIMKMLAEKYLNTELEKEEVQNEETDAEQSENVEHQQEEKR